MPILVTKQDMIDRLSKDGRGISMIGEYVSTSVKTTFKCKEGHTWITIPNSVVNAKSSCPHCFKKNRPFSIEKINSILEEDGNGIIAMDDYNGYHYVSTFMCIEGHKWRTTACNVINQKTKCRICSGVELYTNESVAKRLESDGRGIVLLGNINGSTEKVLFMCKNNHKWMSQPTIVVAMGCGCPECAGVKHHTKESFNKKIEDSGVYIIGEYISRQHKTDFMCNKGHVFNSYPSSVAYAVKNTDNTSCPYCAKYGFNKDKKAILYYVKIKDKNIYKIGVTNRDIKSRFCPNDYSNIEIIKIWSYEKGIDAFEIERFILKKYKNNKYYGDNLLKDGNSELFNTDILGFYKLNKVKQ